MTAEELLMSEENETFEYSNVITIDGLSRTISIPLGEEKFGVEGDKDVTLKHFSCPRTVGNNIDIDLSLHNLYVNYVLSDEEGNPRMGDTVLQAPCENIVDNGDNITFDWKISEWVTKEDGYIAFSVIAKRSVDGVLETRWYTTPAVGRVLKTIKEGENLEQKYPDVIDNLMDRVQRMEKIINLGGAVAIIVSKNGDNNVSHKASEIVEQYEKGNAVFLDINKELIPLSSINSENEPIFSKSLIYRWGTNGETRISYYNYRIVKNTNLLSNETLDHYHEYVTKTSQLENDSGFLNKESVIDPKRIPDMYYKEGVKGAEIFPETTYEITSGNSTLIEPVINLILGNKYIVKYNGIEYQCVAEEFTENEMTGVVIGYTPNNESYPFNFINVPDMFDYATMFGVRDGSTSGTVSIAQEIEVFHQLDPRYIEDMYYEENDITEILNTTISPVADFNPLNDDLNLVEGQTYTVIMNGQERQYVASKSYEDDTELGVAIGDGVEIMILSLTTEMAQVMGASAMVAWFDAETTSLDLKIIGDNQVIHKIPNKYLDLEWLPVSNKVSVELALQTIANFSTNPRTLDISEQLVSGEEYTVNWNGEEYKLVAEMSTDDSGLTYIYIGNYSLLAKTGQDGEPFCIASLITSSGAYAHTVVYAESNDVVNVTVKVYGCEPAPNKMPEEFLPESVDCVIIRSSTEGSTKKFKLTVDDSGTISATEIVE